MHTTFLSRRAVRRIPNENVFARHINIAKDALKENTTTMDLETPRSLNCVSGDGVPGIGEGDLYRSRVVEQAEEVERGLRGVPRDFSEPPESVVGLVPEEGSNRQLGIRQTARHIPVAFGLGLGLGRADAHGAVTAVGRTLLVGKALPTTQDVLNRMFEVPLSLPRRAARDFPVCLVEDCDNTATTSNQWMR